MSAANALLTIAVVVALIALGAAVGLYRRVEALEQRVLGQGSPGPQSRQTTLVTDRFVSVLHVSSTCSDCVPIAKEFAAEHLDFPGDRRIVTPSSGIPELASLPAGLVISDDDLYREMHTPWSPALVCVTQDGQMVASAPFKSVRSAAAVAERAMTSFEPDASSTRR